MSCARKGTRPRMFHPHARVIIFNVLRFMAREADIGSSLISLHKVEERVAMATGISRRTLSRIKKEFKDTEVSANKSTEQVPATATASAQTALLSSNTASKSTATETQPEPSSTTDDTQSDKSMYGVDASSVFLPQVIMDSQENTDSDGDMFLPQIEIKSEMESEDFESSMLVPDYIKTEELGAESDALYCSQNIMLPELIIKSENEGDSDSD